MGIRNFRQKYNLHTLFCGLTMDEVSRTRMLSVYRVVLNLFRFHVAKKLEENDVFIGLFDDMFNAQFAVFKRKVISCKSNHLSEALDQIELGLKLLLDGDFTSANVHFLGVTDAVFRIFQNIPSNTFQTKIYGAQFNILSFISLSGYFSPRVDGSLFNLELLETQCHFFFSKLCSDPVVVKALHDEFNTGMFHSMSALTTSQNTKIERLKMLQDLSSINIFFKELFGHSFDVTKFDKNSNTTGEIYDLKQIKTVVMKANNNLTLNCLSSCDDKLYCGTSHGTGNIVVFDTHTLQQVNILVKAHESSIELIKVHQNKLFTCSCPHTDRLYTIKVWDLKTLTSLHTIRTEIPIFIWSFSDTHMFACCRYAKQIKIMDCDTYADIDTAFLTVNHELSVTAMCVYKNILYVAHPEVDKTVSFYIIMYDMNTLTESPIQFKAHTYAVTSMCAQNNTLYSANHSELFVWDLLTHTQKHTIKNYNSWDQMSIYRNTLFCSTMAGDVVMRDTKNIFSVRPEESGHCFFVPPDLKIDPKIVSYDHFYLKHMEIVDNAIYALSDGKIFVKLF